MSLNQVDMKIYSALSEAISDAENMPWQGWLFLNKDNWHLSTVDTELLLLFSDEELYEEVNEDGLPLRAAERSADWFLEVQTFQDVITTQRERKADSTVSDYYRALNHYREYDSF